jgi:toxin ParE1/3/4
MTRLVVTADADADTRDVLAYLGRHAGRSVAADYGRRFGKAIERLVEMPETGSPRPSLGVNARIAVIFPYVLIYDYDRDSNTLTLLRILHGRRNISQDLLRR